MSNTLFKKVTAAAAALSIVLSVVSPVVGVKAADTSVDAANRLASLGVIVDNSTDPSKYNLGSNITRREMLKVMMNLSSVEVTETCEGKFSDLPASDWGCKYAEAALKAGFIAANAKFRPNDMVTEAEALKMIMQARGVAKAEGVEPWSEAYRQAWVEAGILSADATVSATAAAKRSMVIVSADSAVTNTTGAEDDDSDVNLDDLFGGLFDEDGEDMSGSGETSTGSTSTGSTDTSSVKAGDLEVTLNPASPIATTVPCNGFAIPYSKYDITAGSSDVTVNSMTFTRVGLGSKDDFNKVWIENSNGLRISSRQTVGSDDVVTVTFTPAFVVKAGSTETVSLVAKLKAFNDANSNGVKDWAEACYTGRSDAFNLTTVDSSASNVSGTPVNWALMTTADYTIATVSTTVNVTTPTYQVGELQQEFASFKLTNNHSTRDITLKSLTLKNEGTARVKTSLDKLSLVVNWQTVSTNAVVDGEYVTFAVNNFQLLAGRSETFYVRADVVGMDAAAAEYIQFTVRYPEDLSAIENNTGFGISHDLDSKLISDTTGVANSKYNIQWGDTTWVKSSTAPSAMTKSKGSSEVVFLEANIIVKQEFTTDALKVDLLSDNSIAETAKALKNLKLLVNGKVVSTKSWDDADFTDKGADATLGVAGRAMELNYDSTVILPAGTHTVKLVWDIETQTSLATKFRASIGRAANGEFLSAKYTSNDRSITEVAWVVTGGDITVGTSKATITENSGLAAQTFVAWAQELAVARYQIKANQTDTARVTKLKFSLIGAWVNGSDLPTASVYLDGVKIGSSKSFTTGAAGSVEFTDVNFTVEPNQQKTVELRVSMTNSAAGTLQVALSSIDMKDTNSTDVEINGWVFAAINGPSLTVASAGTLTISNNSSTPVSKVLVASSTQTEVAKFTFAAQNDDIKVTNLYLKHVGADISSRVSSVSLYDNAGNKVIDGTAIKVGADTVFYFDIWDNSSLVVPKNTNSYTVTVKAGFNPITLVAQTWKTIELVSANPADAVSWTDTTDGTVRAVSVGNNTVLPDANFTIPVAITSNEMMITKTAISLATVEDSSLVSTTTKLANNSAMKAYAFSVSADAAWDAELASVVLDITAAAANRVTNVKIYDKDNTSNVIYDSTAWNYANALLEANFTAAQRITAGSTKTYIVELKVQNVAANESLSIRLAPGTHDTSFTNLYTAANVNTTWSDLSDTAHAAPADGTSKDWFTWFKVNGLSSMTSRSYSNN